MADEKSEMKSKSGISILVLACSCIVSVLLGLTGGVMGGPTIKVTLGIEEELATTSTEDNANGANKRIWKIHPVYLHPCRGSFLLTKSGFMLTRVNSWWP